MVKKLNLVYVFYNTRATDRTVNTMILKRTRNKSNLSFGFNKITSQNLLRKNY
jgi:hypothetical protein